MIKTNELQQIAAPQGADSILLDTAAAGTGRLTLAKAAEFFGAELVKPANPVGAALSNKAAKSTQETVEATSIPERTVEVAAADLPAYIAGLPRLLMEHLTISVSGTETLDFVWIMHLYGPGSLTIRVAEGAEVTVQVQVLVDSCSVPITLEGLQIIGDNSGAGTIFSVVHTPLVVARNCVIDREHDINKAGILARNGSHLLLEQCQITHCNPAINCRDGSIMCAINCTGANNVSGIWASGGIVLLQGTTPDLMGGSANSKSGGMIVKADGTVL